MSTFISIVGGIVVIALSICALSALVCLAATLVKKSVESVIYSVQNEVRLEIGAQLARDAYWFSEDQRAMWALQAYGRMLRENNNISNCRDDWRKKISPTAEQKG